MIILKETTKSFSELNLHTYLVTDGKDLCHGYMIEGDTEMRMFKKPLQFSTKGRTFTKVK